MRRLAPVLAACLVALGASQPRADVPAELLQDPAAAAPAPAAAVATTGPDLVFEAAALLFSKKDFEKLAKVSAADRASVLAEAWAGYAPHEKATLEHAAAHFREAGLLVTQRSVALLTLTSPVKIHDEAARDWTGTSAPVLATPLGLAAILKPPAGSTAPPPATSPLVGSMPSQAWVYAGASMNEQRVVWFVDEGADGTWRFAKDEVVPVTTIISTAPAQEMPAELFPATGLGQTFAPLPVLAQDALPIQVNADFFKASAGRTFVRLMPLIDPTDVDLELGLDPAAYGAGATLWLQVERDGAVLHQATAPLASLAAGEPWLAEFGVPLTPGVHRVTALATDKAGKGGRKELDLDVDGFSGSVALSSVVISKADAIHGEAGLPKAIAPADGSLAPFQIGNYAARPQVPPVFKRGDTIAVIVQVYGASKASVEHDLFREGSYQNTTEPTQLDTLPVTDIQQFTVTPEYTDGAYEFRVTAKSGGTEASRRVSFRIKG